jgi:hypothetical protein
MSKSRCKLIFSFLWTNAIVAGLLVFVLFSFIDPGSVAVSLHLDVDESVFRLKSYVFGFISFWMAFNASTYLNCYFSNIRDSKLT